MLWAVPRPALCTGAARLPGLRGSLALVRHGLPGVRAAEPVAGLGLIPARRPVGLERGARLWTTAPNARRGARSRERHDHGGRPPPSAGSAGLVGAVQRASVPAVGAGVVGRRGRHLAHPLPPDVVPPSVVAARRARAELVAVRHALQRAARRERLRGDIVRLSRRRRRLKPPSLGRFLGHASRIRGRAAGRGGRGAPRAECTNGSLVETLALTPSGWSTCAIRLGRGRAGRDARARPARQVGRRPRRPSSGRGRRRREVAIVE